MRLVSLLRARLRALRALPMALAFVLAACGAPATSARITHGEAVTTGDETLDTFFREVTEVKAEADKAAAELGDAARPLQDVIGAQNKNTPADVVRAEAKKLQMSGTLLHLDLVPEAKLVTSAKPEAPSDELLGAAEQTAKGSLAVARRASELLVRIADLERRHADLTSELPTTFPDESKRTPIARELAAARDVLTAAREAAEKQGGAASKLALDLAIALETGASAAAVPAKKPPARPFPGGKTGPAKPKGDDFDK